MNEREYKSIEVKLGNYIRKFEMRETYIGTFVIEGKLFNVIGSTHAIERLQERSLDKYHVMSTIVALGDKLTRYNNNGKHIIISNEEKDVSTIFTIENYTVVLITVLDRGQMHTSPHVTLKETINLGNVG